MEVLKVKNGIIAALLICIAVFTTCEFVQKPKSEESTFQDTLFLSQYRREKKEKLATIAKYEAKLSILQTANDSLRVEVAEKKKSISAYRFKAKYWQAELKQAITNLDSTQTKRDSLLPLLDSLITNQQFSDTACDQTIHNLENVVANRDSSIYFHKQVEDNLRDIQKQQELSNQYLTERLNTAFKNQRKKSRQNKLLAGGLLILSGITTSLLLTQSLK
jgi:hypothetical protein